MNCFEYRHEKLSDPYRLNAEADEHRDTCSNCQTFEIELTELDNNVRHAFMVNIPEGLADRVLLNQSLQSNAKLAKLKAKLSVKPKVWLSMAASFLLVGLIVTFQNQFDETYTQQDVLLSHVAHKPHEFYGTGHAPISNTDLSKVLASFNVSASIENVVYAAVCPLDGENAAHLVIKDGEQQYTVMLIPDRSPGKIFSVDSEVWHGFISPHPAGALAVLANAEDRNAVAGVRAVSSRMLAAINLR